MDLSKTLQETIVSSTIRKRNIDGLIRILTKEREFKDKEYTSIEKQKEQSDEDTDNSKYVKKKNKLEMDRRSLEVKRRRTVLKNKSLEMKLYTKMCHTYGITCIVGCG